MFRAGQNEHQEVSEPPKKVSQEVCEPPKKVSQEVCEPPKKVSQEVCEHPKKVSQEDVQSQNEDRNRSLEQQRHLRLSIPIVMQWLTGQGHKPLLPSDQATFKIKVKFDHQCKERMPGHVICFPLVSACTNTITLPVAHMKTYTEFRDVMTVAIRMGREFSRV